MSIDFSGYFEEIRGKIEAPELAPRPGARAFEALIAPAFDPPFALSVGDFADHADVTLHGQALELVEWEPGFHGWRRRSGGVWRESKTVIGEPLDAFRRSMAEIALDRMTDRIEEGGRDGILLQLTVCLGDRRLTVAAWSPEYDSNAARFTRALVQLATAVLRFDESRVLLRGIEPYGILAPPEMRRDVKRRRVKRKPR